MDIKKRATNFTSKEESLLVELVKKYKNILECKKTDTNTHRTKMQTWVTLAKEFNSLSGEIYRDVKVLKSKYENLKKRTKQKFADEKQYINRTGGGPPHEFKLDDVDVSIKEIIGSQVTGFTSIFDDDAEISISDSVTIDEEVVQDTQSTELIMPGARSECINLDTDHCCTSKELGEKNGWSKYTPEMLRTPKSTLLHTEKGRAVKNPLSKKMISWAESKMELVELQKKCYLEQHQLKLQLMREEHEEKLRLMRKESDAKIELMKISER